MKARLVAIWFSIGSASTLSFFCYGLAQWVGQFFRAHSGGKALPLISESFYPDAILVYLFPVPLALWGVYNTIRHRNNSDLTLLLVAVTLGSCFVFLSIYLFSMALPFIPMSPVMLREGP